MDSDSVDIVVVNHNTKEYLIDCLRSIRSFSGQNNYRILVVDNASSDGSVAWLKANEWVTGVYNSWNKGYAVACNQGILSGDGKFILLLNSDTLVTRGWLGPLIKILSQPEVAVVGPCLVNFEGRLVGVGVTGTDAKPLIRGWGEPNDPQRYNAPTKCLSVCGACMGIKRDLLPRLGLFDEHYFHYFEETDYCLNARLQGFKVIYTPASLVLHRVFGSTHNQRLLKEHFQASKVYFLKKWGLYLKDVNPQPWLTPEPTQ